MSEPKLPDIATSKARLKSVHERSNHPQTVESALLEFSQALDSLKSAVATRRDICENFDINIELGNLSALEKQLSSIAPMIEEALRHRASYYRF